jgi:hypothetical protein
MMASRDNRIICCRSCNVYLMLMIIMVTLVYCVLAEHNKENGLSPAKIVFKEEMHDFGDIKEGIQVEHVFEFSNSGDDTLRITRVQGG